MSSPSNEDRAQFTKAVVDGLTKILEAKATRTQNWLAQDLGISSSTLTNIFKKGASLTADNLEKASKYLLKDNNRGVLTEEILKAAKEYLSHFEADPLFSDKEGMNDKIERYLLSNSDEALLVYFLACNKSGVSLKHLQQLGERYRDWLDEFLQKGWIKQDEGGAYVYHAATKDFNYKSNQLLRRFILLAASFTKPELFNKDNERPNFGMVMTESISDSGMKQITEELVKCSNKIESIINDEKNEGDNPCAVTLLLDTLK